MVGCYTLDLYCDERTDRGMDMKACQFTGETGGECRRQARKLGWRLEPDRHLCPKHSGLSRCRGCKGTRKVYVETEKTNGISFGHYELCQSCHGNP